MRGRSYTPSPPRRYNKRGGERSHSPRGGYAIRSCDRVLPTCSLHVLNLHKDCTPEELREQFGQFGPLKSIYLPKDYHTGKPRGFGFVEFVFLAHATNAKCQMDRTMFLGRELSVVFSKGDRKNPTEMRAKERRGLDRWRSPPPRYSLSPRYSRSPRPRPRHRSKTRSYKRTDNSRSTSPKNRRYSRERSYSHHNKERKMRGRSYTPSPPPPQRYNRRGEGRTLSPNGRYAPHSRDRDLSTTLLVRNLPHDCKHKDLRTPFGQFGPLKNIDLPKDSTGKPRGIAFVHFFDHVHASDAKNHMDRTILLGRELNVVFSK